MGDPKSRTKIEISEKKPDIETKGNQLQGKTDFHKRDMICYPCWQGRYYCQQISILPPEGHRRFNSLVSQNVATNIGLKIHSLVSIHFVKISSQPKVLKLNRFNFSHSNMLQHGRCHQAALQSPSTTADHKLRMDVMPPVQNCAIIRLRTIVHMQISAPFCFAIWKEVSLLRNFRRSQCLLMALCPYQYVEVDNFLHLRRLLIVSQFSSWALCVLYQYLKPV